MGGDKTGDRPGSGTAGTDLLTDPEGAELLGLGITRFAEVQREPDFPAPVWMGPRGKRHVRSELLSWALSRRSRDPEEPNVANSVRSVKHTRLPVGTASTWATPSVLTTEAVSELLGCSSYTVEEMARKGELPGIKPGGSWVFPVLAFEQRINEMALEQSADRRRPKGPTPTALFVPPSQGAPRRGRNRKPLPLLPDLAPPVKE